MLGIPNNSSTCACFKPLMGLFSQSKYSPLTWCPLTLEFEIVGSATDAIGTPFPGGELDGSTSISWQIEDVRLIADVVTLDNGLQNSYEEHVLSGKSLPISYSTYISILQRCTFPNINVSVTRAVSKLKTVFF